MSVEQAKSYIRRLRTDVPLRQTFERVWQGKRFRPDDVYVTREKPVVPQLLAASIPDDKTDPEGYRRWWRLNRAQQDMHDLLFSSAEGLDHAQRYLDGESVSDVRILEVIGEPEMEEVLGLLARIAAASTGDDIGLDDMKEAWHGYVRWIYRVREWAGAHPEVRRLRRDAAGDEALKGRINTIASLRPMSAGTAYTVLGYVESGFAHEEEYEAFEKQKAWLEAVAQTAGEAGYRFSATDYLKDCIAKQREDDPGPERNEDYWPEDDPNRWNYEAPPVFFSI